MGRNRGPLDSVADFFLWVAPWHEAAIRRAGAFSIADGRTANKFGKKFRLKKGSNLTAANRGRSRLGSKKLRFERFQRTPISYRFDHRPWHSAGVATLGSLRTWIQVGHTIMVGEMGLGSHSDAAW